MQLETGFHLGHYEIVGPLGAGGMGEVYRARDPKLEREVAIKVLPEGFAESEERLARFEREAKSLAALNHPNVATVYGFEREGDTHFLVMELVEGEDLSERIARGPIPVDEAIPLFVQVAEGLEAAHEKGIVHRDLKPANIMVSADGRVKILDFGLAKAMEPPAAQGDVDMSQSPTMTAAATMRGEIMGTAAYMSPEQAKGQAVDKRSDIWAFGCCLYEALVGARPFQGSETTEVLASVLRDDPSLEALDAGLRRVVSRCLQKQPGSRYHAAADVRLDLGDAMQLDESPELTLAAPRARGRWLGWALAAVLGGYLLLSAVGLLPALRPAPAAQPSVTRMTMLAPDIDTEEPITLSPDGRTVVYLARTESGRILYRRDIDSLEPEPIEGTEGSWGFGVISPDSQWIAYVSGDYTFLKQPLEGGRPTELHDAPVWFGVDWAVDASGVGQIVFTDNEEPRVQGMTDAGDSKRPLTTLRESEIRHEQPQYLPGGKAIVFEVRKGDGPDQIATLVLGESDHRILMQGRRPRYIDGYLIYQPRFGDPLWAVPFDPSSLAVQGEPIPVPDLPLRDRFGGALWTSSTNGAVAYLPRSTGVRGELVWLDRSGQETSLGLPPAGWMQPRVAPGGRLAFVGMDGLGGFGVEGRTDVFVLEPGSSTPRVISAELNGAVSPFWSLDGKSLYFSALVVAGFEHELSVYSDRGVGGLGFIGDDMVHPTSWTTSGSLVVTTYGAVTNSDIFTIGSGDDEPRKVLGNDFDTMGPTISPDGRWFAYGRLGALRSQILVRPFPGAEDAGPWTIAEGDYPLWVEGQRDGEGELFFLQNDRLMSVRTKNEPPFVIGDPVEVLHGPYFDAVAYAHPYAYDRENDRFLVVRNERSPRPLVLVEGMKTVLDELSR